MKSLPCLLAVLLAALPSRAQDQAEAAQARLRVDLQAEGGQAYVGQRVRLYIEVLVSGPFDGNPRFDLPQVPGALLLKLPGRPTPGSTEIDGTSYLSQRHGFAIYAQRAGEVVIPPITVRAKAREGYAPGPSLDHRLLTEELRFAAIMPPGAEGLSTLISAPSFTVEESWQPQPGVAETGDAFTRTVAMQAEDVLGLAFPPLPIASVPGLRVYPKAPEVGEENYRGRLTGRAAQTFVYVCEQAGTYELPALRIPWFDLQAGELRVHELPAVTLSVAEAPEVDEGQDAVVVDRRGSSQTWWGIGMLAFFGLVVWRTRLVPRLATWLHSREAHAVNQVRRAAHDGHVGATLRAVQDWFARFPAGDGSDPTLSGQAELHGGAPLRAAILDLQEAWARGAPWQAGALLAALRGRHAARRVPSAHAALPPLNP